MGERHKRRLGIQPGPDTGIYLVTYFESVGGYRSRDCSIPDFSQSCVSVDQTLLSDRSMGEGLNGLLYQEPFIHTFRAKKLAKWCALAVRQPRVPAALLFHVPEHSAWILRCAPFF